MDVGHVDGINITAAQLGVPQRIALQSARNPSLEIRAVDGGNVDAVNMASVIFPSRTCC